MEHWHALKKGDGEKSRARSCACRACIGCFVSIVLIAAILGIVYIFIRPRLRDVQVVDIKQVAEPNIRLNGTDSGFSARYDIALQVDNPGDTSWTFTELVANVFDKPSNKKLGGGSLTDTKVTRNQVQSLNLPATLDYRGTGNGDEIVSRFAHICGQPRQAMDVRVSTTISIKGFSWIYKPTIDKDFSITCPQ
ncbi:hypothetical protein THASP1DRAFT_31201 [Thamnocephalis sphaerospora]|uniref:Late embryogenesis abundant protein LEA-2 subgroup domain-containing protein n=1 Tax=Thamnocephalis sphaerospora TaxID=78915 RepID=A0A4P9XNK2_9FUNG|nr:hypothetical protein THASP1DRAFT_31201 [Thamnocephalis sphaerospora]|eukprot:RKP06991.1 hypothetical protein THASP1DRAFT_31201 [Thamnocephalis sphaerospora]